MERERIPAAMLTAAVLASAPEMTAGKRSLVTSLVAPFDLASPKEAEVAIARACAGASVEPPPRRLFRKPCFMRARSLAEEWLRKGVFIISAERLRADFAHLHRVPPILFGYGLEELLDQEIAAIVNSRKPRRPGPGDLWVDAVKAFFNEASASDCAIASSCGTLTYDLVSRLACRRTTPLIVVCDDVLPFMAPANKETQYMIAGGNLFPQHRTLFLSPFPPGRPLPRAERLQERDRVILSLASRIFVVALRRGGTLEPELQQALARPITVTVLLPDHPDATADGNTALVARGGIAVPATRPASTITRRERQSASRAHDARSKDPLVLEEWPEEGSVLVHYTRSCPGPWPGETRAAYLDSVLDGVGSSGHTGFDTLVRILEEGRIRACGRLTRGGRPVVSLTECLPGEVHRIVRWRRALIRWSFEPYAIAVDRTYLKDVGAQRVIYGGSRVFAALPEHRCHLFQLNAPEGPDWTAEKEWRILGDLYLDEVPNGKLTVFVKDLEEARIISERFGCRVTLAGHLCERAPNKKQNRSGLKRENGI